MENISIYNSESDGHKNSSDQHRTCIENTEKLLETRFCQNRWS